MKMTTRLAPALAAVLMMMASTAHADMPQGWYVGLGGGLNLTPELTAETPAGNSDISFNTGWNGMVNGGYAWNCGWRVEGEVFHTNAAVDDVGATGGHGRLTNTDLFVNGLYDFNMDMMMTPYVGVGVGAAMASPDNVGTLANGSSLSDDAVVFAYQAIAGVAAQLDNNWAVTADYRYVATLDPDYDTTTGGQARTDNRSHNIVFGVRYSFYEPTPVAKVQAPAVRPTVASRPAVAPVPQSYMVFFDFDQSTLTDEAKQIIATAASDYKSGKYVQVVVTGHTDTVGTASYNQALSQRRAAAVKAEFARNGVSGDKISTAGAGKSSLLVPTADGVREAQNRRAEIIFKQ